MPRVLITGAAGFVGGYLVKELLDRDCEVVGLDDFSKYGKVVREHDDHERYRLVEGDARDTDLVRELLDGCEHFVAGAALVGGVAYLNAHQYEMLAVNERITASAFDAAIDAFEHDHLRKITLISSSMVFESNDEWPVAEGAERSSPPPQSAYGFQKLAVEYFARAAFEQHGLPYTIIRPFNIVGTGEVRGLGEEEVSSGGIQLAMGHVVPDLVQKVLKGQDPLHIIGDGSQVRAYTYGADLAQGIVAALLSPAASNEDFNISTATGTSVCDLAALIWRKIKGDVPLRLVHEPAMRYDAPMSLPSVEKARNLLGFETATSLDEMLDIVIPYIADAVDQGVI